MNHRREGETLSRPWLPVLPVPLRQHEAPATLNFQALVDLAYTAGRYDDLDCTAELDPPLAPEDATWAGELLMAATKRWRYGEEVRGGICSSFETSTISGFSLTFRGGFVRLNEGSVNPT